MKSIAKVAARTIELVTADLAIGQARKIDTNPAFMALHVERLPDCPWGPVYSLAHYFEQGGDLVADPDITILRGADGGWYPLAMQGPLGYSVGGEFRDGQLFLADRTQRELAQFVGMWARNIRAQQDLRPR